ncbi:syntaxin-17 isoform X1 [Aricia agestis]|uniref:syntaxin-17 isoform X1 n=1 Tax=Aricia agestis TaxID=91739 RepID=UPI001C20B7A2|nr:syntaxin-17 isoform X1 [Aricia agestis]
MEEEDKLPLKRVEVSLSKFNEVAIPHHLDLLRQHKANIIKYGESESWSRVRAEQAHARRVANQLRGLLRELDALRRRVRPQDLDAFDRATRRARENTHKAIMDYLGVIERSCIDLVRIGQKRSRRLETAPMSVQRTNDQTVAGSAVSTDSVGVVGHAHDADNNDHDDRDHDAPRALATGVVQLQIEDQELSLREREATLRGWSELQAEVRALHDAWQSVQAAALAQRDHVSSANDNVEVAADNVKEGRTQLALAERIAAGSVGAGGAVVGALVGGPLGALVGAKVAAAAALGGGALGYLAAAALGRRRAQQIDHVVAKSDHDTNSRDHDPDTSDHDTKKDR